MFSEILPNRGSPKYASYFTWKEENKLFNANVLWMNDKRIHQDMRCEYAWLFFLTFSLDFALFEYIYFSLSVSCDVVLCYETNVIYSRMTFLSES